MTPNNHTHSSTNEDLLVALERIIMDIDEYSPNWSENPVGGLTTVMLELYSIKQAKEAIRKAKGES